MKIKVLGASGSETPDTNLTAFLVDDRILLDAGTIGRRLSVRDQSRIRYILLTHSHLDHVMGIPFLLDNMNMRDGGKPITVVSGSEVLDDMKRYLFNNRLWPDFTEIRKRRPLLQFRVAEPKKPLALDGYRVVVERVDHTVPAYGFILEDSQKKAIAYTGDTGPTELFWEETSRYDVACLIIGVAFPDHMEQMALDAGHLTPSLLKREIQKMKKRPPKIYVSHAKNPFGEEIRRDIEGLGYNGIEILREGRLVTL